MDSSVWDLMGHGGYAMWLIVAFSVIAMAVAIERAIVQWQFTTRARDLAEIVNRCLDKGALSEGRTACERSPSPLADVFLVGYERLGRGKREHLAPAVHRERMRVGADLKTRLWILGTIGATAPFVGLFGTVIGIMSAMGRFKKDEVVTMGMVSKPISEALVVTAAGILVAVEAVILFNYFNQRASRIATEMKLLTDEFLELLGEVPPESTELEGGRAKTSAKGKDDGRQAA
ncbi:MAG: MotA/TolQ/ExbB proton channel family protein [Myxococcales bacterium]|nr:MotA/TolQ/ExbB proton channel family protein [Myxococcales bacterium]MBK7194460.1 MotA/TolQ/ExbB proton channel family protein [Myxococcales bacterium]MBP6848219.1 MotA/TolQ/ExbB proton channel family protein [Kofleriaceae bacterium]